MFEKGKLCPPTHTSGQGCTPHSPASTQASDLTLAFQTVARKAGKDQRVADPELEAYPPAVRGYSRILARLQAVLFDTET